jgi:hypothetical protein
VFTYNLLELLVARWANDGDAPLAPGKHTTVFGFTYDCPGVAKGGTGVLTVDDRKVGRLSFPKATPFLIPPTRASTSAATHARG